VLACATFTVILVHDERPRLFSSLEFLGHTGYRIYGRLCRVVIVIESNINFAVFIVNSLTINEY
jgi:hypothetical protein